MTLAAEMTVTIRLPTGTLFQAQAHAITAVAPTGAFGLLPNHIDFISALVPSVLTVRLADGDETVFGIDEGILVKRGHCVDVAVRRGVRGDGLENLRDAVEASFIRMDEDERQARAALSRLEADMVRRFAELRSPPR